MKRKKNKPKKLNNAGMTLAELTVTFAILGLFLVAATRIISYTINIYYAAKGASYGLEVSNMISNKIVRTLEGARTMSVTDESGSGISFIDATGSEVTIETVAGEDGSYINIHYEPATYNSTEYEAVDWKFDEKAYMGFSVETLKFTHPNGDITEESSQPYPDNVVEMELVLKSDRYGAYGTTRYIKCAKVD